MRLTMEEILPAIEKEDWQKFRDVLRGKPTQEKLDLLLERYWDSTWTSPEVHVVLVQIQNYLNALARGGFIKPTDKDASIKDQIKDAEVLK
jgi:hypothetical protein